MMSVPFHCSFPRVSEVSDQSKFINLQRVEAHDQSDGQRKRMSSNTYGLHDGRRGCMVNSSPWHRVPAVGTEGCKEWSPVSQYLQQEEHDAVKLAMGSSGQKRREQGQT